ncbi:hypothetical protein [Microbacterium sp. NPDC056569]|uniref:hypothetical protein n=1 Tax=Microbacterium sp. NPDC056569 TaxID=3345867 RepID=UPI003671303F
MGVLFLAGFGMLGLTGASAEPAPTPGCVFTGGAFTCGGAVPPEIDPAPHAPDVEHTSPAPPEQPLPSEPSTPAPSPLAPASTRSPEPVETTDAPAAPSADDSAPWIPATMGVVTATLVAVVALFVTSRRRSHRDDGSV